MGCTFATTTETRDVVELDARPVAAIPRHTHDLLDPMFYETFELKEQPRDVSDGDNTMHGARCRLRNEQGNCGTEYFVLVRGAVADLQDFSQLRQKVDAYATFRESGVAFDYIAALPPVGVPWNNCTRRGQCPAWIVTEYVPCILSNVPTCSIPPLLALNNIIRAAKALHDAGYVHRDIAPSNIGLRDDGTIVLIDFGFATKVKYAPPEEGSKTSVGQLAYMSILQHESSVAHPADDIESAAYVALWFHVGRNMTLAHEKKQWMQSDAGGAIERHIRRVARFAAAADRSNPPSSELYRAVT